MVIIMEDITPVITEDITPVIMAVTTAAIMVQDFMADSVPITDILGLTIIIKMCLMGGMRGQAQCHRGGTIIQEVQALEEEIHIFQVLIQEPEADLQEHNMQQIREELLQPA
jgi:hypothetical protein